MKYHRTIYLVFGAALMLGGRICHGGNPGILHIGLSPFQTSEDAKIVRRQITAFILSEAAGTVITVHDAYALKEISRFPVPLLKFDSPEERGQRLMEPFAKLAKWFDENINAEVDVPLKNSGALRIPECLDVMSRYVNGSASSILLIGSPIVLSVEEPAFSMAGNRIPSDEHLRTNISASIYGTSDKGDALSTCTVHFCYLTESIWSNQLVKSSVRRFWNLFVSRQNGVLATFSADLGPILSDSGLSRTSAVIRCELDPNDSQLEMRVIGQRIVPSQPTNRIISVPPTPQPVAAAQPVVTNRPVATPNPPIPVTPRGRIGIAVWWNADADVDLYVSTPGERELYFRNVKNKAGEYYRDIRQANESSAESGWREKWEYVELSNAIQPADVKCWLNLYKVNHSAPESISGMVRVQYGDGRIVEAPFTFTVTSGNGGADANRRSASPYWVPVNLFRSLPAQ